MKIKFSKVLFFSLLIICIVAATYVGFLTAPTYGRVVEFDAPSIHLDGTGSLAHFKLFANSGNGRLLVDVAATSFLKDSENSLRKAKLNAEKIIGGKLS